MILKFKEYFKHTSFYGSRNKYGTEPSDWKRRHVRQKLLTRLLKLAKAFSILSGMGLMNEGQHRLKSLLRNHRPWSKRSYSRITQAGTLSRYKWINPWRHFCKRSQWLEKLGRQIFGASYRRHHLLGVCYQTLIDHELAALQGEAVEVEAVKTYWRMLIEQSNEWLNQPAVPTALRHWNKPNSMWRPRADRQPVLMREVVEAIMKDGPDHVHANAHKSIAFWV